MMPADQPASALTVERGEPVRAWHALDVAHVSALLNAEQWSAVAWTPLSGLLGTVPLAIGDWVVVAAAISWPVLVLEVIKGRARAVR